MYGKFGDRKTKHLAENVNFHTDALSDLLHIRHAVQGKMQSDVLSPLVHILNDIHILSGQYIIGIVSPLEKERRRKVHALFHFGKLARPVNTVLHA